MMSKRITGLVLAGVLGAVLCRPALAAAGPARHAEARSRIVSLGELDNRAMDHLHQLVNGIGSRPVGTPNFLVSCKWALDRFTEFGLANARLEQCGVYPGEFPAGAEGAFFRSLYASTPGNEAAAGEAPVYNVVADIPGAELPDEYVIVGAHLDSAPQGPGATDNGAGVAAVMEAARLIAAADVPPRRTIRFVLFGGEEAGLIGSKGYLEAHPDLVPKISAVYNMDHGAAPVSGVDATEPLYDDLTRAFASAATLDPELPFTVKKVDYLPAADPNCCASLAAGGSASGCSGAPDATGRAGCGSAAAKVKEAGDGAVEITATVEGAGCGSGAAPASGCGVGGATRVIREVTAEGDTMVKVLMIPGAPKGDEAADLSNLDLESLGLTPAQLAAEGKTVRKMIAIGSSDHAPFLAAGIPAFWFAQEAEEPVPYPAHSPDDTYHAVDARYLEHSATVIALGVFGTANLDHMLSRVRLAEPVQPGEAASASAK